MLNSKITQDTAAMSASIRIIGRTRGYSPRVRPMKQKYAYIEIC